MQKPASGPTDRADSRGRERSRGVRFRTPCDGHEVSYSRDVDTLGPEATDADITNYAERESVTVLSTDVKDFSGRDADIPVFVAPQDMTGGDVRAAVARVESMPFDPAEIDPIWLSSL